MQMDDDTLNLVRSVLVRHGITQAWQLDTDYTELVVLLKPSEFDIAKAREIESGMRDVVPNRKIWVVPVKMSVRVRDVDYPLKLWPIPLT
jgi:hypothetical protein